MLEKNAVCQNYAYDVKTLTESCQLKTATPYPAQDTKKFT
jgi:hypothetical protein